MGQAFNGAEGKGSVLVYTVPRAHSLRLELLTFIIGPDNTAGIHKARVTFYDSALAQMTAYLRDLNEGGPLQTLRYTYGIGLNASACVAVDGWEMTDALPDTDLAPDTEITISSVNDAGTVIVNDDVYGVVLYGTLYNAVGTEQTPMPQLIGGLLPGSV